MSAPLRTSMPSDPPAPSMGTRQRSPPAANSAEKTQHIQRVRSAAKSRSPPRIARSAHRKNERGYAMFLACMKGEYCTPRTVSDENADEDPGHPASDTRVISSPYPTIARASGRLNCPVAAGVPEAPGAPGVPVAAGAPEAAGAPGAAVGLGVVGVGMAVSVLSRDGGTLPRARHSTRHGRALREGKRVRRGPRATRRGTAGPPSPGRRVARSPPPDAVPAPTPPPPRRRSYSSVSSPGTAAIASISWREWTPSLA